MLESKHQVSVIIPTYNRKHLLEPTLSSVFSQTHKDYEIIVVDDASDDGTTDWLTATYPEIRLIRMSNNRGAAGARNEGIRLASGEFIAFLDSDDRWEPNYLEAQVKALQNNPKAVLAACDCMWIKRDGSKDPVKSKPWSIYPDLIHHLLMNQFILSMSIVVIRHEALLQVGLLNERLKLCEDRELYLRLFSLGEMVYVSQNLATKIDNPGNLTKNYKQWSKDIMLLLDIFYSSEISKPYKHIEAETRSKWAMNAAKAIWQSNGDLLFSTTMLFKAFLLSPYHVNQTLWKRLKGR